MRKKIYEDPTGKRNVIPTTVNTKFPETRNCYVSDCESCMMPCSKKKSTGSTKFKPLPEKQGVFTRDKYKFGYFVSMDQFIFNNPGQLSTVYGRDSSDQHFQGGTIYNDASLVMIWIENQVSLGINDTVMVKSWFKKWFWEQ